jgi:hypothetical protein
MPSFQLRQAFHKVILSGFIVVIGLLAAPRKAYSQG